jgi:pimeloyl-ACP methyl ester carboxylesterase
MSSRQPSRDSLAPARLSFSTGEKQGSAIAEDGTHIFVRSRDGDWPAETARAVLCDGILCDGFIWKYVWDDLAPLLPITHWHYRGHGRSATPVDSERIGIADHAGDLQAVRASVGNPNVVLFGHSMGCQVALEAYRRYPEKIVGLVLICGSFGRITKLIDLTLKAPHVARALWSRVPPATALKLALRAGEIDAENINPADMMPYLHHMTHVDLPMFLRMLRAAGEHSAWEVLRDVNVPTLVIAGERDTFTPASLAREMARAIPHAELMMIARGTHVASIEHPVAVDARIAKFLKERVLV